MPRVDQDDEDELEIIARYQALGYAKELMCVSEGMNVAITDLDAICGWLRSIPFPHFMRALMAAAGIDVALTDKTAMIAWLREVDFGPAAEPTT